mgnify:CR=1 FL=1
MTISPHSQIRWRLAQLAVHLVVALIALVVVGGATRVMEAGLACPDWPLCFGSFLPGRQMNLQVFLEWFHRLDAFLIGIALLVQLFLAFSWRSSLPFWYLRLSALLFFLVLLQGALGAFTVWNLLESHIVTAHLAIGLILVATMSSLSQKLLSGNTSPSPIWWRFMAGSSLIGVIGQCLLGGKMATTWSAQKCLTNQGSCALLNMHRSSAIFVACFIFIFIAISLIAGGWPRTQWPFLLPIFLLVILQINLGILTVSFGLSKPIFVVAHQLLASLLVALLSALTVRSPGGEDSQKPVISQKLSMEPSHG